jgi:hypothetical protein
MFHMAVLRGRFEFGCICQRTVTALQTAALMVGKDLRAEALSDWALPDEGGQRHNSK